MQIGIKTSLRYLFCRGVIGYWNLQENNSQLTSRNSEFLGIVLCTQPVPSK